MFPGRKKRDHCQLKCLLSLSQAEMVEGVPAQQGVSPYHPHLKQVREREQVESLTYELTFFLNKGNSSCCQHHKKKKSKIMSLRDTT